jgi:GGDEF domain-containing protein
VIAATALLRAPALVGLAPALVPAFPWTVFGVGILLGWRFHRDRLLLALVVLFLADRALLAFAHDAATVAASPGRAVFSAIALLLPFDLAAIAWLPERGLLARRSRVIVGFLLIQIVVAGLLSRPAAVPLAASLEHSFLGSGLSWVTAIPQPALVAFGAAFALTIVRFALTWGGVEGALVWALAASFLALTQGHGGLHSTIYLATGGLLLVVSIVEISYRMAYGDELTGLPARRALDESLASLDEGYTIAMVDIDHFKKFNDEHGHDVGDQLLRRIGSTLLRVTGGGRPYRYGGEEFTVVFPGKSVGESLPHLEALRKTIEEGSFTVRGGFAAHAPERRNGKRPPPAAGDPRKVAVTVSIGAAEPRRDQTPEDVIKAADAALYRAKQAGRNRIEA